MADPDLSEVARRALADWPLNPVRVESVSHSENIVFKVTTADDAAYVLRFHRPGYHSFEELVSEQLWTSALIATGLDVPVPKNLKDGRPYNRVKVGNEDRFVGVLEWVEGSTMGSLLEANDDPVYADDRFQALGELLGQLHNQASAWVPPATFTRQALNEEGLMGRSPFWGPFWEARALTVEQRTRFSALRERIYRILGSLPKDSDRYSMIHADLHPGNVIVNGRRLHVIDFDDSGFGWHGYDLAVALKDYQDDQRFPEFQAALIRGYRSARALPDEALAEIPLFLLIRALASIGWADARPELGHPEYVPGLATYVDEQAEVVLAPYD